MTDAGGGGFIVSTRTNDYDSSGAIPHVGCTQAPASEQCAMTASGFPRPSGMPHCLLTVIADSPEVMSYA